MTFGEALEEVKRGAEIRRANWDNKWVGMVAPGPTPKSLPYLYRRTGSGERVPWPPRDQEMLADDWEIA